MNKHNILELANIRLSVWTYIVKYIEQTEVLNRQDMMNYIMKESKGFVNPATVEVYVDSLLENIPGEIE